ncbi:MAG: Uncharacterized amino acid permease, GabP family, partial [uncultured Acetobacteraceae bacterium]
AAHGAARHHLGHAGGDGALHRRRHHRRVRRALAGAGRRARPAGRGDEPRRALDARLVLRGYHRLRGGQHGAAQLRHGVAPHLRHGAAGAAAIGAGAPPRGHAHALHGDPRPVRDRGGADAERRHHAARLRDRAAAAGRVLLGEPRPPGPATPPGRAARRLRGAFLRPRPRRPRLPRPAGEPGGDRRLARAGAGGRGAGRHRGALRRGPAARRAAGDL